MKKEEILKFSEYPFIVPTEKRLINKLESLVQELKECGSDRTAILAIKHMNKYSDELETQISNIYVRYTLNTGNKTYAKAMEKIDELTPIISKYTTQYNKILLKAPYRKALEAKFGKTMFKKMENSIKAFDESIMDLLVEENKLVSEYDKVKGAAEIKFRGQTYNLPGMAKFLDEKDRETRKEAAQAIDKWYGDHDAQLGEIYDKLVHLRTNIAKKLGYKSFTELGYIRMGRIDYNAKDAAKYRDQILEDVVPVAQKLYKVQMKNLGIKNPQFYDYYLSFKNGNAKPAGDTKYVVNCARDMYAKLGNETKEYFQFMIDHELLDLDTRAGKAPGGYQTYFPNYKSPFIFANGNGTADDVATLTHEGGHAFQAYSCKDMKIPDYRSATLETCEIHSMSMEFFAWPYMDTFFKGDAEKYKYSHLSGAIQFLPYGVTVDEFQHWVYEHPNATHEERCAFWKSLEAKYEPHKVFDDTPTTGKGRWWLRQGHIFTSPFYYIDYTLAQVVAFQFLVEDQKNHEKAWKKYVKLCKCGGTYPFVENLEKNHLRNPFEDGNIKKVMGPLSKILKGFDTSKF